MLTHLEAGIVDIKPEALPPSVAENFEQIVDLSNPGAAANQTFTPRVFTLYLENDILTYGATSFDDSDPEDVGHGVHLLHVKGENTVVGTGEMTLLLTNNAVYKDKPFANFTATNGEYQRQGLGHRRILELHAAALALHGLPLHSDISQSAEAKRRWEKLVSYGDAERYTEMVNGKAYDRYVMLG